MASDEEPWVSRWVVAATAAAALATAVGYAVGLPFVTYAAGVTAVGVTYVLYRWGQHRESPSERREDSEKRRRERETEAEAGSYGGGGS